MVLRPTPASEIELDEYLNEGARFRDLIEIICVAGCCGLEAFSLTKKDIARVASTLGANEFLA